MRQVTTQTEDAWLGGDHTGPNRAMARATISGLNVLLYSMDRALHDYEIASGYSGGETYSSVLFGQMDKPFELPNIKSVRWSRSIDTDCASCTLVLYNTAPLPIGAVPPNAADFGQPGYYTHSRGKGASTSRWGYTANGWQDRIVPDRIIRTYEGYGYDKTLPPESDPHMYPSGVWLVDDVDYTADGLITVTCRDIGRALLDQIMFPPVVPFPQYPLHFEAIHDVQNPPVAKTTGGEIRPQFDTDSVKPYWSSYPNGVVFGHHGKDAFDGRADTFWLSVGNAQPNTGYAYEWVQGKIPPSTLTGMRFQVWGGPYTCYVSVRVGGVWQGSMKIPYDPKNPASAPNGADIPCVVSFTVGKDETKTVAFNKAFVGADAVRLTFTNLFNSGLGKYKYRAGVREIICSSQTVVMEDGGTHLEGNFEDFSEPVRKLLAYGGFYWPRDSMLATRRLSDGSVVSMPAPSDDPFLGRGRVWGDIEKANAPGRFGINANPDWNGDRGGTPVELPVKVWDKKPLMDGIAYVRDLLGYLFFIDEDGAAVFRSPNIWSLGNYVGNAGSATGRTSEIIVIDEDLTLLSLGVKLSSRNVREHVFVGNEAGKIGAVSGGFNPYPSGLRRVGGWTDQNFASVAEAQVMADLIKLRQYFTYRSDGLTIPGYPAIQIDDQVRIFERVTNESFVHYVKAIDSTWDVETGVWTYSLQTHWLGEQPFDTWAFDPYDTKQFADATRAYLEALGKI